MILRLADTQEAEDLADWLYRNSDSRRHAKDAGDWLLDIDPGLHSVPEKYLPWIKLALEAGPFESEVTFAPKGRPIRDPVHQQPRMAG
ncbi:hypothetical protein QBC99_002435 [Beijerinckia sp. GAS462]|nr:hypothetical protein [Beijerinckia sp. GAS462]SEC42302.1 hypothetical protein SAMN05443249_2655 [Beijerinckia sp. 28-YEA-48]